MSAFLSWFVIILTVANIIGCVWLLQAQSRMPAGHSEKDTTGHVWDKDLTEYNKPMPRWWLVLFWLTAVFGAIYLVIYPGLGTFTGTSGWTQTGQYESEMALAEARYGNVFKAFADVPLADLANNPDAVRLGRNLFLNNCPTCHGSDARGARPSSLRRGRRGARGAGVLRQPRGRTRRPSPRPLVADVRGRPARGDGGGRPSCRCGARSVRRLRRGVLDPVSAPTGRRSPRRSWRAAGSPSSRAPARKTR